MKALFLAIAVLSLAAGCGRAAAPPAPVKVETELSRSVVDPYLKIQVALARDTTDGVHANADTLATAAAALGVSAAGIRDAAVQLSEASKAEAADIADVREKFGTMSAEVDTYMTDRKLTPPGGGKVAFCPMMQKPWLQTGDTVSNPYYGKDMPTCGSFQ